MKWFEVIADLGDGSSSVRRFKTREAAEKYEEENEEYCYAGEGVREVDTDSKWFFYEE